MPKQPITKLSRILTLDLALHCGRAYVIENCPTHFRPLVIACGTVNIGNHTVKRWLNLEAEIKGLLDQFSPELIIIEENFQFRNVRSTAMLNQLRGVIMLIAAQRGTKVDCIDNNTAKKTMLGNTQWWNGEKYVGVTKDMMKDAVTGALCSDGAFPQDFDSADAVALALTYFETPVIHPALPRKPKTGRLKKAA